MRNCYLSTTMKENIIEFMDVLNKLLENSYINPSFPTYISNSNMSIYYDDSYTFTLYDNYSGSEIIRAGITPDDTIYQLNYPFREIVYNSNYDEFKMLDDLHNMSTSFKSYYLKYSELSSDIEEVIFNYTIKYPEVNLDVYKNFIELHTYFALTNKIPYICISLDDLIRLLDKKETFDSIIDFLNNELKVLDKSRL